MIETNKYYTLLENTYFDRLGKVSKIVGLTIESIGPDAKLNDLCEIIAEDGKRIMAEVVGFRDKSLLLMPFDSVEGVGVGCITLFQSGIVSRTNHGCIVVFPRLRKSEAANAKHFTGDNRSCLDFLSFEELHHTWDKHSGRKRISVCGSHLL